MKSFADELIKMPTEDGNSPDSYTINLYHYAKGLEFALECIGSKVNVLWRHVEQQSSELQP